MLHESPSNLLSRARPADRPSWAVAAALCVLLLGGCAQLPVDPATPAAAAPAPAQAEAPVAAEAEATDTDDADEDAQPARAEALPNVELSRQIMYQLLLAEIAGRRGSLPLSVNAYLDLAKTTRDPRIARRAAELAHFARQSDAALEAAQLWIEIDPESPQARQLMAGLLAGQGRYEEVVPHVAALLARDIRRLPEALLSLSRLFARHQDKAAVHAMVVKLTEPYLNHPEARLARAQAALAAGEGAAAVEEADQALRARPTWELAILIKAQALSRDKPEQAMESLRGFLAANPKARDVRLQYARLLTGEKKYEEARSQFQRLLADFPENADVVFAVGALSHQLQDYAAAERSFRRLMEMGYGDQNTLRLYLGQIAESQKRLPEALDWYAQVGAGEQYIAAQTRYAQVLVLQGKLDDARAHLQQAAASNNRERVQLLMAEAQILRSAGRAGEAFELLDKGLVSQPNQPELLYETALLAERVGRNDILEANLRKLIHLKPDHAHAYNALGYSLAERNERLDEARQLLTKALELAPDDPFILDSMGWLLYRQGDLPRAVDYLQRALRLRSDPEIAAHLGEVLWALGRREDAKRTWRDADKANPGNEVLTNVIKRFLP